MLWAEKYSLTVGSRVAMYMSFMIKRAVKYWKSLEVFLKDMRFSLPFKTHIDFSLMERSKVSLSWKPECAEKWAVKDKVHGGGKGRSLGHQWQVTARGGHVGIVCWYPIGNVPWRIDTRKEEMELPRDWSPNLCSPIMTFYMHFVNCKILFILHWWILGPFTILFCFQSDYFIQEALRYGCF